jgi:hypothetical protein
MLSQQEKSRLMGSPACVYFPSMGKTHNLSRMGGTELTQVTGRNPLKQYADYNIDNRHYTMNRFTKTFQIDSKDDINDLVADPTSDLYKILMMASQRTIDRQIVLGASGAVNTGDPGATPTSVSASSDGVRTITATGGVDYSDIKSITQTFINNDIPMERFLNSTLCLTGKENSELMDISQFTNNDFIGARPVEEGVMRKVGKYNIVYFAGSENGGITVPNPILPEATTTRTCVILAPDSVALSYKLNSLRAEQANDRVDSQDITIDMWIGVMRIEGPLVQLMTTTL